MKKAFSLVELIFVIVIISILLTIALPKFFISRDDALVVSNASNLNSSVKEIARYYITKGKIETNATKMSSFISTSNGWSGVNLFDGISWNDCINLKYTNGNLELKYEQNDTPLCNGVKKLVKEQEIKLSGTNIEF